MPSAQTTINQVIDAKVLTGASVSAGGTGLFFAHLAEWVPLIGGIISILVGSATFYYVMQGIKLRKNEIERQNSEMKRRSTDQD